MRQVHQAVIRPTHAPPVKVGPPFKAAAPSFGVEPIAAPFHNALELESVVAAQAREPNGIAMPDSFQTVHRAQITSLAARHRLPAVYAIRFFAEAGGLLSYGNDRFDNYRGSANYVDRVLRGANPAELPVQIPTKFELMINLKAANALDLTVPPILLALADKVIALSITKSAMLSSANATSAGAPFGTIAPAI